MGCIVSVENAVAPDASSHKGSGKEANSRSSSKISTSTKGSSTRSKVSVNSKGEVKSKHLSENIVGDKSGRDINEFYDLDKASVLGTGVSGSVRTCIHKKTHIQFAMKTLNKRNLKPEKLMQVHSEISIMAQLDHPNILRLFEFFETEHEIFLIVELCKGGELLDRLHEQMGHRYSERTACKLVYTMLSAVRYCHANNIVHRDLKLENFLFEDETPDSHLKLIDFGLSQHFEQDEALHRAVGTPYYVSPEVLQGNYNCKCDIWSIGVVTYILLSGVPPFYGPDDKATLQSVRLGKWTFNTSLFRPVSVAAKNFITMCLDRNVSTRPSAAVSMKHQWFQLLRSKATADTVSLDIVDRIRGFTRRSPLSRLCMEVVAHCLADTQIASMREEFGKFDLDHTGEISYADMQCVLRSLVSTGELTEQDIDQIFSGVNFDETGIIQYHEFIAATVSRRTITEENMRIAFDRISRDEDFITSSDLCDLLGQEMSNDQVGAMLKEIYALPNKQLDYKHFRRIMLGGIVSPVVQRRIAFLRRKLALPCEARRPFSPSLS